MCTLKASKILSTFFVLNFFLSVKISVTVSLTFLLLFRRFSFFWNSICGSH